MKKAPETILNRRITRVAFGSRPADAMCDNCGVRCDFLTETTWSNQTCYLCDKCIKWFRAEVTDERKTP